MPREPQDQLDQLFSRLRAVEPPPTFTATVIARARASAASPAAAPPWSARRWAIWGLVDLVAALVLVWAAFGFGQTLASGVWVTAATASLLDLDLALDSPTEWLLALNEVTSIFTVGVMLVASVVFAFTTQRLMRQTPRLATRTV
ncbi:MAG: hypothetical protein NZ518_03620 [Dehalococcoidia bacterium]|nr:hypothetical protein [Dehalococcoidia bacterium]